MLVLLLNCGVFLCVSSSFLLLFCFFLLSFVCRPIRLCCAGTLFVQVATSFSAQGGSCVTFDAATENASKYSTDMLRLSGLVRVTTARHARALRCAPAATQQRFFSEDAADSKLSPEERAEHQKRVRNQATKVKQYTEEVNRLRIEFAKKHAAQEAAIAEAKQQERELLEKMKLQRAEAKRQRAEANIVRAHDPRLAGSHHHTLLSVPPSPPLPLSPSPPAKPVLKAHD